MRTWPGRPFPLGAHWDGHGTHFALFSRDATAVELLFFEEPDAEEPLARVALEERDGFVWHAFLPDVRPGLLYAYRVDGPWEPARGQRFDPERRLLDPYARAICGATAPAGRDRTPGAGPRGVVVDPAFPWTGDAHPRTPWSRTVLYECHVKGMTAQHPEVPEDLRGTYLGLASEPVVAHLRSLGVTAVELLPVHQHLTESFLGERGLTNYWGYNTLGFFAPDARFARGDRGEQVSEFKSMVKSLHRDGIEVILDVVFNHTAEGNEQGPTLSWRGIDNRSYYHLDPDDPSRYSDFTGCGNTLDVMGPPGLRLLLDSLRTWTTELHVDGFRFDLAPAMARRQGQVAPLEELFEVIRQDPALQDSKLIVEPWDAASDGYRLGGFPPGVGEWNDRYRDSVRRFWRGDPGQASEFATRVAGSADVLGAPGRGPLDSINFVACHDGFTLRDVVSYDHKHNDANGEDGADGHDANWSHNWGAEGSTEAESILELRDRIARNLIATLAFSQGVPMLGHGDELGRTQAGNNNAYCHDDGTTWIDWSLDGRARSLLEFTREVFELRARHPILRRRHFFQGARHEGAAAKDVLWLHPEGREMTAPDWEHPSLRAFGMLMPASASVERDERGRPQEGGTLALLFNGGPGPKRFALPAEEPSSSWDLVLSTTGRRPARLRGRSLALAPHSLSVLQLRVPS